MFIFDRCRRSSAAVAPVKYECDWDNLTGAFIRSKILLTEKLTNGALVTPAPGLLRHQGGSPGPTDWYGCLASTWKTNRTEGNNECNCQIRDKECCSPKKELKNVREVEIISHIYINEDFTMFHSKLAHDGRK